MDPVIVVGAGPVGLALALALARHEVPSIVLDEGAGVCPESPRTVVLGEDAAALLARLGYHRAVSDAATWDAFTVWRRRAEVLRIPLDGAPVLHLAQHRLQRGLRDAVTATPLIQLVSLTKVVELEQDRDGVSVRTTGSRDGARTWWRGSHLVGCDGARSTVRKLLKIRFPGRPAVDRHAVATVRVDLPFAGEARLHREPPWRGDREACARPLPDGLWRLDWRLPPGRPAPTEPVDPHATWPGIVTGDTLLTRVKATLTGWCGELPAYELLAAADHTAQQRLAARFRSGRCFLAGDAAHLHGALGMQNLADGLRDADNLSWRLALAWHLPRPGAPVPLRPGAPCSTATRPSGAAPSAPGCAPWTRRCRCCARCAAGSRPVAHCSPVRSASTRRCWPTVSSAPAASAAPPPTRRRPPACPAGCPCSARPAAAPRSPRTCRRPLPASRSPTCRWSPPTAPPTVCGPGSGRTSCCSWSPPAPPSGPPGTGSGPA
ncbi:FAD-dependent monooxygenase [Kitasatospora paranensis]|uniref:FAD-dependent monooxygenase n=1 Tax=Kitasatospora paranensis TaxID=258053 RepID=UPI0031F1B5ED